jgi:hypothetical protein
MWGGIIPAQVASSFSGFVVEETSVPSGGGLAFDHMVISLGYTASGKIYIHAGVMNVEGTVVPAYVINSALGNIPLLGKLFTGGGTAELHTSQIEGDEILLEDTTADIVRGKRVEIGPGCNIESVEYSESLRVVDGATVRNRSRI